MGCSTSMQKPPAQAAGDMLSEKPQPAPIEGVAVTQPQTVGATETNPTNGDAAAAVVADSGNNNSGNSITNPKTDNRRASKGAWDVVDNEEQPEQPPQQVTLSTVAEETPIAVMSPGPKSPSHAAVVASNLEDSRTVQLPEEQQLLLQSAAASDFHPGFNDSAQPSPRNANAAAEAATEVTSAS